MDLGGATTPIVEAAHGGAGVPAEGVFKTSYRGDLFGTGGNYMGGYVSGHEGIGSTNE